MVRAFDLRLKRSRVRSPASRFQVTVLGKLFTHTHVPLSPSSIIWYRSRGGWEGNRRLEVALVASRTLAVHPLIQEVTERGRETSTPPALLMGYGTL